MANPKSRSCRNIGWWQLALVVVCLGSVVEGRAQAPNDSCLSAIFLGYLNSPGPCLFVPDGSEGYYPTQDSTHLAGAEFPYPIIGVACEGYTNAAAGPSNDVWYSFQPGCHFSMEITPTPFFTSDSIHISLWHGPNCAQLVPLRCYTIPANTSWQATGGGYPGRYYLQIASPSINTDSHFSICIRAIDPVCAPTTYDYGSPTPVQCFPYSITVEQPVEPESFGGVLLELDENYGPFAVEWDDGTLGLLARPDLPIGDHWVMVTGPDGCVETIDITIQADLAQGVPIIPSSGPTVHYAQHSGVLQVQGPNDGSATVLEVFDSRGRLVGRWLGHGDNVFPIGSLNNGLFVALVHFGDSKIAHAPFVVFN